MPKLIARTRLTQSLQYNCSEMSFFQHMNRDQQIVGVGKTVDYRKMIISFTGHDHV